MSKHTITIDIPEQTFLYLKRKLDSGEFASERDVIVQQLSACEADEQYAEHWLKTEVQSAHQHLITDRSRATPLDEAASRVLDRLRKKQQSH